MTVLHRIVSLIITLLTIDSATTTGIAIFQFSGALVSALAEIQTCNGVQFHQKNLHEHTPNARHIVWQRDILPRLQCPARVLSPLRKKLARRHREKLVCINRNRNKNRIFKYDQTLGYPGEGWSGWSRFQTATWNTRSLTKERFQYAKSLAYDILAITELWRHQGKYQSRGYEFIVSEPLLHKKGPHKGKPLYPNDRAAGVGILLSPRMQKKCIQSDREETASALSV